MLDLAFNLVSRSKAVAHLIDLLQRLDDSRADLLRVLTYHRIDEPCARPDLDHALVSATPGVFDEQMRYLAAHYHVISMAELLDSRRRRVALPPRSVLVTVDDAYGDFETNAWPILRQHRIPVTLFVPTAYPDRPDRAFWWDRLHCAILGADGSNGYVSARTRGGRAACADRQRAFLQVKNWIKSLPHDRAMACVDHVCAASASGHVNGQARASVLGWAALRRLAAEGVTLAAHSQTHPLMNRLTPDEARREAVGSRDDLHREIGSALPVFAYPAGGVSDAVVRALKAEDFSLAFTTARGINDLQHADPLRLRRINVGARTSQPIFSAQLLPWLVHLNRWA